MLLEIRDKMSVIYYGESECSAIIKSGKNKGKKCSNKAYYECLGKESHFYTCGVHKINPFFLLPKNKGENQNLKNHNNECEKDAERNRSMRREGLIRLEKINVMKSVPLTPGYVNIFPNYKHGNRKDGIGMPSLSPKAMKDIDHKQPGLPISKNLENLHQGNKVFPCEIDEKGKIMDIFYQRRLAMYNDPIPHRHKLGKTKADHIRNSGGKNASIPLFSIWIDQEGKERRYTYLESRKFYCNIYAYYAYHSPEFLRLIEMIKQGYNIKICGYDCPKEGDDIYKLYQDPSNPFGHELVLYSLLLYKLGKIGILPWVDEESKELLPHIKIN